MDSGSSNNGAQRTFAAARPTLAADVVALLAVPDRAQVDLNLVSMVNYLPLLGPLLDQLDPKRVVEIGADRGTTTAALADWCRAGGRSLTVVDPVPPAGVSDDATVTVVAQRSLDYLPDAEPAQVYLIDGDHNHATVTAELAAIHAGTPATDTCLVVLHDVSWPWGRRDMTYDRRPAEPAAAADPAAPDRSPTDPGATGAGSAGASPGTPDARAGEPAVAGAAVVSLHRDSAIGLVTEGYRVLAPTGRPQGVLTAVEQFLDAHPDWQFCAMPSMYGLGLLWHPGDAGRLLREEYQRLADTFTRWEPFLATLEFNRLELLEQRQHDGAVWQRDQRAIAELAEQVRTHHQARQDQQATIARLQRDRAALDARLAERDDTIAALHRDAARQAELWADQQRAIDELSATTTAQRRELDLLRTPTGWLRARRGTR